MQEIVRCEQHDLRVVDEMQLLHGEHWLTFDVDVHVAIPGHAVLRLTRTGDDLRVNEGPELLPQEVRKVRNEASGRVQLRDGNENRGNVECLAGNTVEVQVIEGVDHGGRRVRSSEELQLAALMARTLRQREIACRRGHESV